MSDDTLSNNTKFNITEDFESSSYKHIFPMLTTSKKECVEIVIDNTTYFYRTYVLNGETCCKIEFAYADKELKILKIPEEIDGLKVRYFTICDKNLAKVETIILSRFLLEMDLRLGGSHKVKTIVIPKDFEMSYLAFADAFKNFHPLYRRHELFFDIEKGNINYVFKDRCLYSSDFKKLILFSGSHHIKEINIDERVEELLPYSLLLWEGKHSIDFNGKFKKLYDRCISEQLEDSFVDEVEFYGEKTLYTFYEEYDEEEAYREGKRLYDEEWFLYDPGLKRRKFYNISKEVYYIHPNAFASFYAGQPVKEVKLDKNNPYFNLINGFLVTKRQNKLIKFFSGNAPAIMKRNKFDSSKAKNAATDLCSFTEKLLVANDKILQRVLSLISHDQNLECDKLKAINKVRDEIIKTINNGEFVEYNSSYDLFGEPTLKPIELFLYKSKQEELEKWFEFGEIELPKKGIEKRLFFKKLSLDVPSFDSNECFVLYDLQRSDIDFFESLDVGSIRIYYKRKVYALVAGAFY